MFLSFLVLPVGNRLADKGKTLASHNEVLAGWKLENNPLSSVRMKVLELYVDPEFEL